jgi:hypothetical protein
VSFPSLFGSPPFVPRYNNSLPMPVLGFRLWSQIQIWKEDDPRLIGGRLKSLVIPDYFWSLDAPNLAICLNTGRPIDDVQCSNFSQGLCKCGLYMHKRANDSWPAGIAIGYGQMLEHSMGFRVTKARILVLFHDVIFDKCIAQSLDDRQLSVPILPLDKAVIFAKQHGDFLK